MNYVERKFIEAISRGDAKEIMEILEYDPNLINLCNEHDGSALFSLCFRGEKIEYIEKLLDLGASDDKVVRIAITTGNYDIIKLISIKRIDWIFKHLNRIFIDALDYNAMDVLHVRDKENVRKIIMLLIEHGAALDTDCLTSKIKINRNLIDLIENMENYREFVMYNNEMK